MTSSTRIYVGRLSHRASERDIEHFFRGYGRIRDMVLKNGFGFVEFDDPRDADDAVYELNGKELCGERVILEFSRRLPSRRGGFGGGGGGFDRRPPPRVSRYGPPQQTRHRLVVENLSSRCSWQDLKDIMRGAGEVTYADAHKQHPNEGVVCFGTRADLKRAVEKFQGKDVNGRKIKLVDDSEKTSSSRSRSRSRSRSQSRKSESSRSRSRSRSRSGSAEKEKSKSRSRSRSESRSPSRSRSRSNSPEADEDMKDENKRSASPE